MADFYELWKGQSSVTDELRRRLAEAAAAAPLERESTIRVQRLFRGAFVRSDISAKRDACISITRVFRGHRARSDFRAKARERVEEEGLAVFYYHSSIIQRAFRGFYSRKHYHDYSARKKYIDSIKVKGDLLREQLAKHHASQMVAMEAEAEEKAQREFNAVTQNLHHLVSTRVNAGIYNSPYSFEGPVTVNGIPVEDHINSGVRSHLREKGIAKKGLVVDANGSRKIPVKPPATRLSVQAASPYDAVEQQAKIDVKLSKAQVRAGPFKAGYKVHDLPYRRGLNEGTPHCDPWRNPYLQRGVPAGGDAELSQGRTSLDKAPPVHFYTAVGGNMSTVLPNGLFDVMLDAQESGGVARRHKGLGARFGVADTCDVREDDPAAYGGDGVGPGSSNSDDDGFYYQGSGGGGGYSPSAGGRNPDMGGGGGSATRAVASGGMFPPVPDAQPRGRGN